MTGRQETIHQALSLFQDGYACSQAILLAFADRFGLDREKAKMISSTFGGGMGRLREKCGAVTGGFMALGLAYGNTDPKDMETKLAAYRKVRELDGKIRDIYGTCTCSELLKKHATEGEVAERKHHVIICGRIVGDVAGILYDMMEKDTNYNRSGQL